jgi:hypothetical protein
MLFATTAKCRGLKFGGLQAREISVSKAESDVEIAASKASLLIALAVLFANVLVAQTLALDTIGHDINQIGGVFEAIEIDVANSAAVVALRADPTGYVTDTVAATTVGRFEAGLA